MTTKDRFYLTIIAFLVIIIFLLKACGGKCPPMPVIVEKTDTAWRDHMDTITQYTPQVTKYIPVTKTIYKTDSIVEYELVNVDTSEILKDYFATRYYSDTQSVQYGKIVINDSVTKNRIASRSIILNQLIPEVTKTVTVRDKQRNQIYFGLSGAGNNDNIYAGASLMLKTRRDFIVEGGALLGNKGDLIYQGGMKFLIRLKRK